jgi:hypothetical protein
MGKSKVLGERGIKDAKRVREIDATIDLNLTGGAEAPCSAGEVAETINGKINCIFKRAAQVGGSDVGKVMLNVMHLGFEFLSGETSGDGVTDGLGFPKFFKALENEFQIWPAAEDEEKPPEVIHLRVQVDRDVIEVADADSGLFEAKTNRFNGNTGPMLNAEETLLLNGGDEFSIFDDGC